MEDQDALDKNGLLASAVQYLIEGNEFTSAELLLWCEITSVWAEEDRYVGPPYGVEISLRGPRMSVDRIDSQWDDVREQVRTAFSMVLPFDYTLQSLTVRASVFVPDANWRSDLHELIKGQSISNQASGAIEPRIWQGFRFRSATEIKIAEALDSAGVLFFPLPKARVALEQGHINVEPDFVICHEGRWGILEVDGEPFHPPERSAIEHDRDRLFLRHGVVCIQRFDAKQCYQNPQKTVEQFLLLMVKAYRRH